MSAWRWLLFAAMARFETSEEEYLRIPSAKTVRRDFRLDEVQPKPQSTDTSGTAIE